MSRILEMPRSLTHSLTFARPLSLDSLCMQDDQYSTSTVERERFPLSSPAALDVHLRDTAENSVIVSSVSGSTTTLGSTGPATSVHQPKHLVWKTPFFRDKWLWEIACIVFSLACLITITILSHKLDGMDVEMVVLLATQYNLLHPHHGVSEFYDSRHLRGPQPAQVAANKPLKGSFGSRPGHLRFGQQRTTGLTQALFSLETSHKHTASNGVCSISDFDSQNGYGSVYTAIDQCSSRRLGANEGDKFNYCSGQLLQL